MPANVRAQDAAKRTIAEDLREIGEEVRRARITHGLSQAAVAQGAKCSQQAVHRVEQATFAGPWRTTARICTAVGLRLRASVFPAGNAVRDTAQLGLLEDLRTRVHESIDWSTEVPLPRTGDPRSWDAMLRIGGTPAGVARGAARGGFQAGAARSGGARVGIEAETRPTDIQEVLRRTMSKKRDGGVDRVILLLRDTRHVRRLLREHGELIAGTLSLDSDGALAALAAGRMPTTDSIIVLPTRRAATQARRAAN